MVFDDHWSLLKNSDISVLPIVIRKKKTKKYNFLLWLKYSTQTETIESLGQVVGSQREGLETVVSVGYTWHLPRERNDSSRHIETSSGRKTRSQEVWSFVEVLMVRSSSFNRPSTENGNSDRPTHSEPTKPGRPEVGSTDSILENP